VSAGATDSAACSTSTNSPRSTLATISGACLNAAPRSCAWPGDAQRPDPQRPLLVAALVGSSRGTFEKRESSSWDLRAQPRRDGRRSGRGDGSGPRRRRRDSRRAPARLRADAGRPVPHLIRRAALAAAARPLRSGRALQRAAALQLGRRGPTAGGRLRRPPPPRTASRLDDAHTLRAGRAGARRLPALAPARAPDPPRAARRARRMAARRRPAIRERPAGHAAHNHTRAPASAIAHGVNRDTNASRAGSHRARAARPHAEHPSCRLPVVRGRPRAGEADTPTGSDKRCSSLSHRCGGRSATATCVPGAGRSSATGSTRCRSRSSVNRPTRALRSTGRRR
jgi:hypothetical protein